MENKRIRTKGNIEVQNIKIGDIHYEFDYGYMIKSKVIELPIKIDRQADDALGDYWKWKSEVINRNNNPTGEIIEYGVTEGLAHYGPRLYDYIAYIGYKQL